MKTANLVKYISLTGVILVVIGALLKTGGNGTSLMVVLIASLIFIAASIRTGKSSNTEKDV